MKVYIDRTHCDLCQSYCDRHSAKLIRFFEGTDRPCIQAIEDDGQKLLTIVVRDGANEAAVTLEGQDLDTAQIEGLSPFLPWVSGASGTR